MRNLFLSLGFIFIISQAQAQELNCEVQVQTPTIQTADPQLFRSLETAIFEFLNNRKWTDDQFLPQERINCKIIITITEELSSDRFRANATIQSSRPVYNSDYNTVLFNYVDKEWEFQYSQYQPLEYNENQFLNNLSSLLAYYAYVMIGLDYDSFSPIGGTPHYLKAQSIVNSVQNISNVGTGWKSFENMRNRYWLIENLLHKKYELYRTSFYDYHLNGLDRMYASRPTATSNITQVLYKLMEVEKENPNSMVMATFFLSKSDELVQIYQNAAPPEKTKALNALLRLDAANSEKYQSIMK